MAANLPSIADKDDLSPKCQRCEYFVYLNCKNDAQTSFCIAWESILLFVYLSFIIWLGYKLFLNFSQKFSFRNLITICAIIFLCLRFLRYCLVLARFTYVSKATFLVDSILYWIALQFIVAAYTLILAFWISLCSQSKVLTTVMAHSQTTKWILVILNVVCTILLIVAGITTVYGRLNDQFTAVVVGICLILAIFFLVEGKKVRGVLKETLFTSSRKSEVINKITFMAIGCSVAFIASFVVTVIFQLGVNLIGYKNYYYNQVSQIVYRFCEFGAIGSICIPLNLKSRTSAKVDNSVKNATTLITLQTSNAASIEEEINTDVQEL